MKIHYLQHAWFEGLGMIEPWGLQRGHSITFTRLYDGQPLPDIAEVDWLVVMGGPMNVDDTRRYPWLTEEKRFIGSALKMGRRILGVCLGAQLLANVMGARVYPNPHKEIGWFPVRRASGLTATFLDCPVPDGLDVLHWHGDTFDLPAGARHLLTSEACRHQAFRAGDKVLGLQFHLEMTPADARRIVDNCRDELTGGLYIQSESNIVEGEHRFDATRQAMTAILDHLATP